MTPEKSMNPPVKVESPGGHLIASRRLARRIAKLWPAARTMPETDPRCAGIAGREHQHRVAAFGVLSVATADHVAGTTRVVHLWREQDVLAAHDVVEPQVLQVGDQIRDVAQGLRVGGISPGSLTVN